MANNRNNNKLVVPAADNALNQLKLEIASELGIDNYDEIDKGALPARVHGAIGGSMTKRLIEIGQQTLSGNNPKQSTLGYQEYANDMKQELESATTINNQTTH